VGLLALPVKLLPLLLSRDEPVATLPPLAEIPRLLGLVGGEAASASSPSHSSDPPATTDSPALGISDGKIGPLIFILSIAALTAFFLLALRRELRAMKRWPLP
jgi:hypothetical protein